MKDPRQYVRIAVDLPSNRKLKGLDSRAKWLHLTAICWCGQNLTDGHFDPAVAVAMAGVPAKFQKDLIDRGIWHAKGHACLDCPQPQDDGDLYVHHYYKHQESAEKVRARSVERSLSARRGNHVKWNHPGKFEECEVCND